MADYYKNLLAHKSSCKDQIEGLGNLNPNSKQYRSGCLKVFYHNLCAEQINDQKRPLTRVEKRVIWQSLENVLNDPRIAEGDLVEHLEHVKQSMTKPKSKRNSYYNSQKGEKNVPEWFNEYESEREANYAANKNNKEIKSEPQKTIKITDWLKDD